MNKASKRTVSRIKGIDHRLSMWVGYMLATCPIDFFVTEGMRTAEKQNEYFKKGTSKLDGYNKIGNHQLGRAVDIYYVGWTNKDSNNDPRWTTLREHGEICAKQLGLELVFGYDWGWDKPHVELKKGV